MANDDKNTDALATMTLRDHFAVPAERAKGGGR